MNTDDLKALRNPLILLAAIVAIGVAAIFYLNQSLATMRKDFTQKTNVMREARTRLQRSGDEKQIIVRQLPSYSNLERIGFVGEEQRLNWVEGLRLSNQQSGLLEHINRALALLVPPEDPINRRHSAFRLGYEATSAALMLVAGRNSLPRLWLDGAMADITTVPEKSPFSGQQLLARGLKAGPQIGAIVAEAERLWIAEGMSGDAAIQNSQLERAVKHILD